MSDQATNQNLRDTERRSLILEGATGEMSKRLDNIHEDIRELRGDMSADMRELRSDIKKNSETMNERFSALERNLNSQFWRLLLSLVGVVIAATVVERLFL